MLKELLMRKMMERELGKAGVPKEEQEKLFQMVLKNPELFQKIAVEAKHKIDSGMDQTRAMQEVMLAHKTELEKLTN